MKNNGVIFLILAGLILTGCASGLHFTAEEQPDGGILYTDNPPGKTGTGSQVANLVTGEKLTYDVSWIGIPVGQLVLENHGLEVINGEEAYHLTFATISNEFLSNFFKIEDTVHSWVSRESGSPVRFEKVVKEGHYGRHEVIEYDRENLTATYRREDKKDREPETMSIPPDAQDLLSTLFWIRRQPMGLGKQLKLNVNADRKNWDVEVEIIEKGLFETELIGKVKAFAMVPSATHNGAPLKKGDLLAWITVDRRRIPLAFEVETPIFGSAVALLSDAVLPELPDDDTEAPEEEETPEHIYGAGDWIRGLTWSVEHSPSFPR
ncbi:MAG: DUF3108 domain-containing protein [PVC group bacterium]